MQSELKSYVKKLKQELESLNNFYIASCRHTTYYKDFVGDKISFSTAKSLQRKDWEQRHIHSVQKTDGSVVDEPDEILEEIKSQYVDLFSSEIIVNHPFDFLANGMNLPRLTEDLKRMLDSPISAKEVQESIHAIQGAKTPGFDGIPIEFYWMFSEQLSVLLSKIFTLFIEKNCMFDSAYEGVICLLYKGSGDRTVRNNWRPLTMLNLDYKIFAKLMARRLEKVMNKLVHPDQTSSVPGRTIRDSIAHVMSVIDFSNESDADCMILSLDHQAAFDMVEWDYMFKIFEIMNFGPLFLRIMKTIYCRQRTKSCVQVNGFLSDFFFIERGIRQGCPMSALIYNIISEFVANFIRKTNLLSGIDLYGTNTKITKYADDTSLFLSKWTEVKAVFDIFELYRMASGSMLKEAKTQILLLGGLKTQPVPHEYGDYVVEKLKLYGFSITSDGLDHEENWNKCNESIDSLARRLPPYGISLFGKIHFIHIYYLCMFNYVSNFITPSDALVMKTMRAIKRFLWYPVNLDIVKRNLLKLSPTDGGIGLPDFKTRILANRLTFLGRVLSCKEALSWRRSFFHFYRKVAGKTKRQLHNVDAPKFYKEIRIAVIESEFRKVGDFCWIFNEQVLLEKLTAKFVYDKWIKHKFSGEIVERNVFWANHLGVSEAFVKSSWKWAKTSYVCGLARDIHYKTRVKALYTKHKSSAFLGGPNFCTICFENGNVLREDNFHLMIMCSRANQLFAAYTPLLERIAGVMTLEPADFIFGKRLHRKNKQKCFNFLIQHMQLAIWQSRQNKEKGRGEQDVFSVLRLNVYRNLFRIKVVTNFQKFFELFGDITTRNNSTIGFQMTI